MLNLIDLARNQVLQANSLATGSLSAQFQAAGRYVAAGNLVTAVNELITGLYLSEQIPSSQYQSLVTDGFVPLMVSLSSNVNGLNPAVLAALAPVASCGWFWRRGCDLGYLAILTAIAAGRVEGILGCAAVAAIPFIGPALAVLCAGGVGILSGIAIMEAQKWLDGWYAM
jgi:hypothetical protein